MNFGTMTRFFLQPSDSGLRGTRSVGLSRNSQPRFAYSAVTWGFDGR